MEGLEPHYKQALTFLPPWARGVQVFANVSSQRRTGALVGNSNFNFFPRSGSWGVSLTRPQYSLRFNWNYRGERRTAAVTGVGPRPPPPHRRARVPTSSSSKPTSIISARSAATARCSPPIRRSSGVRA
jgi:hypothetical protein